MEQILKIPNAGIAHLAKYKEQVISDYINNPLIEALPPLLTTDEVAERLAYYPEYNPTERQLDSHYRIHMIQRLFQVFQPIPINIDLESRVARAIRQGYISRCPFTKEMALGYLMDYSKIQGVDVGNYDNVYQTACGFSLLGISGLGKTSTLERILRMYNKIIVHSQYKGINFSTYQVVWQKLECPFDASIKGLILQFLSEIDRMLGSNYHEKTVKTRPTTDVLISVMNNVMRTVSMGLLVIDEIQNLNLAKSGGSEKMLNFFVNLVNVVNVPIILVGTPNAIGTLQSQFRLARRGTGQGGDMVCDRIPRGKVWDLLVNAIWGYQWTKKETPLTQEFIEVLYDESQGIPDLLKKIYAISQVYAISSGSETITPTLIRKVAKDSLKLIQPMIQALRTSNTRLIAKYEDISIPDISVSDIFHTAKQSIDLDIRVKEIREKQKVVGQEDIMIKKEKAVLKLLDLGFDVKKIQKALNGIIETNQDMDINQIVISVIETLTSAKSYEKQSKVSKSEMKPSDVRAIAENAKQKGVSVYDSLKESGIIVGYEDDVSLRGKS